MGPKSLLIGDALSVSRKQFMYPALHSQQDVIDMVVADSGTERAALAADYELPPTTTLLGFVYGVTLVV